MKTDIYLERFFAEKEIDSKILEVEGENGMNFIPVEVVIEHIMIAPDHEKKKIADKLRRIDFHDGNVMDFLEHLAKAIAK